MWLLAFLWIIPLQSRISTADSSSKSHQVIAIYPVTTGLSRPLATPISKIVVTSSQTGPSIAVALAAGKDVFHRGGLSVIEKTPSSSTRGTQGPQRRDHKHDDGGFLAFGKSVGADHVMLVEVTDTLVLDDRVPLMNMKTYLHDERVSIKGIDVTTGTVVLEGTARWSQPVERAGEHIRELTTYAIARAICAPEKWVEASAVNDGRGRCRP